MRQNTEKIDTNDMHGPTNFIVSMRKVYGDQPEIQQARTALMNDSRSAHAKEQAVLTAMSRLFQKHEAYVADWVSKEHARLQHARGLLDAYLAWHKDTANRAFPPANQKRKRAPGVFDIPRNVLSSAIATKLNRRSRAHAALALAKHNPVLAELPAQTRAVVAEFKALVALAGRLARVWPGYHAMMHLVNETSRGKYEVVDQGAKRKHYKSFRARFDGAMYVLMNSNNNDDQANVNSNANNDRTNAEVREVDDAYAREWLDVRIVGTTFEVRVHRHVDVRFITSNGSRGMVLRITPEPGGHPQVQIPPHKLKNFVEQHAPPVLSKLLG